MGAAAGQWMSACSRSRVLEGQIQLSVAVYEKDLSYDRSVFIDTFSMSA